MIWRCRSESYCDAVFCSLPACFSFSKEFLTVIWNIRYNSGQNGLRISEDFPIVEKKYFEVIRCTGIPHSLGKKTSQWSTSPWVTGNQYWWPIVFWNEQGGADQVQHWFSIHGLLCIRYASLYQPAPKLHLRQHFQRLNKTGYSHNIFHLMTMLGKKLIWLNTSMFLSPGNKTTVMMPCLGSWYSENTF